MTVKPNPQYGEFQKSMIMVNLTPSKDDKFSNYNDQGYKTAEVKNYGAEDGFFQPEDRPIKGRTQGYDLSEFQGGPDESEFI